MSNSLDPDQARRFDLGPNCLPRLSADDTGRQRVDVIRQAQLIKRYIHSKIIQINQQIVSYFLLLFLQHKYTIERLDLTKGSFGQYSNTSANSMIS